MIEKKWKILQERTKNFSVQIINAVENFPFSLSASIIGKQLIRSATSIDANYRAACRARSKAEFIAKIGIFVEETDETIYWLELAKEVNLLSANNEYLLKEAQELLLIFTTSLRTAKKNPNA